MLSASHMAQTLYGLRSARGNTGSKLQDFCDAVAAGIVQSVQGKPFQTVDTGSVPGTGAGSGVGVILASGLVSSALFSASTAAFGGSGPELIGLCDDIESALISEMALSTLTSSHAPVFVGTGTITPGSIPVTAVEVSGNVSSQGAAKGLLGAQFPAFANAIGTGVQAPFPSAGGSVTITGTPTGTPAPGAGVGQGTIT